MIEIAEHVSLIASRPISGGAVLVVGSGYSEVARLRAELQAGGYEAVPALGVSEAQRLIGPRPIQLIIALGEQRDAPMDLEERGVRCKEQEDFRLVAAVASLAAAEGIPVLLVHSVWSDSAVVWGLRTGADYFLFAPYQAEDLLRAVHEALLNGRVDEPAADFTAVEVLHQDRTHLVTAGRRRLAHLGFSATEQLRRSAAAQAWLQAEIQDLRQQLRQEREQSQLSTQIPELVQGIGHDFSNLLETISAASAMLRADPSNPEPYRNAMDAAIAQSTTLLGALQNWAHLKNDGSQPEPVDLASAVREVLEAALLPVRAPKIRVRVQMEGLPPVLSSRPLLIRALNNLVRNAVEAMPSGGLLSLLGYRRRQRVALEVSDTGVGIEPNDQGKIFTMNHTTKHGHLGIGLVLVRNLVERSGGKISFASRPGRGTTFAFSLPMAEHDAQPEPVARQARKLKAV